MTPYPTLSISTSFVGICPQVLDWRKSKTMTYRIAGRITLNLIAEIIVTVVTVSLAIFWMASRQNDQAEDANRTMVLGGISAMEDHVKQFANDYAWWEAGYDAYVKGDREWVDENYGSGITD